MSTWKPGSRGRPPAWAIEKGLVTSKTVTKSPIKTVKTMNKTASKDSPIKKNTWRPGSRGRVPDWYKEVNPDWKDDNKDTLAERKFKDLLKKKQSTWTPGKPGRPPLEHFIYYESYDCCKCMKPVYFEAHVGSSSRAVPSMDDKLLETWYMRRAVCGHVIRNAGAPPRQETIGHTPHTCPRHTHSRPTHPHAADDTLRRRCFFGPPPEHFPDHLSMSGS